MFSSVGSGCSMSNDMGAMTAVAAALRLGTVAPAQSAGAGRTDCRIGPEAACADADLTGAGPRFLDVRSDTDLSRARMPDGTMCAAGSVGACRPPAPSTQRR